MSTAGEDLHRVLEDARAAGFLGPGPVDLHSMHAEAFGAAVEGALGREPVRFADLGTGGGVPGLVLATRWLAARGAFVESNQRRCEFLRQALVRLGLDGRVAVVEQRAEDAARVGELRESFEAVTARSFAEPAVTAEIAAGLIRVGGILVVSEPPDLDPARWPADGLERLGFGGLERIDAPEAHFVVIRKVSGVPPEFPRKVGRPGKRPLW